MLENIVGGFSCIALNVLQMLHYGLSRPVINLQKYFLNKVDGQCVGARPKSSLGFSLIFVEKIVFAFSSWE